MGFPADRVARALAQHNNDEEQAAIALVGGWVYYVPYLLTFIYGEAKFFSGVIMKHLCLSCLVALVGVVGLPLHVLHSGEPHFLAERGHTCRELYVGLAPPEWRNLWTIKWSLDRKEVCTVQWRLSWSVDVEGGYNTCKPHWFLSLVYTVRHAHLSSKCYYLYSIKTLFYDVAFRSLYPGFRFCLSFEKAMSEYLWMKGNF